VFYLELELHFCFRYRCLLVLNSLVWSGIVVVSYDVPVFFEEM
jgi:hypothetical protein